MNLAVDLHMHSCLSPCGDELMTPNNICNMCKLKGLDIIAVTDHNTAKHLPVVKRVADYVGIALLPGMELTTAEEVHLLAYFRTVDEAVAFSDMIYEHLPPIPNNAEFFGRQVLLDEDDEEVGEEPNLLISALDLGIDELTALINEHGGLAVPAHINRGSNGLLVNLGFLPPTEGFAALELSDKVDAPQCDLGKYKLLYSSDAHYLENISEREYFLNLPECSADALFDYLTGCKARVANG